MSKEWIEKYRELVVKCLDFLPCHSPDGPEEFDPRNVHTRFASNRIDVIFQWAQNKWPKRVDKIENDLTEALRNLDTITKERGLPRFRFIQSGNPIEKVYTAIEYLDSFLLLAIYADKCRDKSIHRDVALTDLLKQEKEYLQDYGKILETPPQGIQKVVSYLTTPVAKVIELLAAVVTLIMFVYWLCTK